MFKERTSTPASVFSIYRGRASPYYPIQGRGRTVWFKNVIQLLDTMRTQYLRLPSSVKAAIAPALRIIPFSARFGRTYKKIREDIARSETDAQFVQQYQLSALRQLVHRASSRSAHFSPLIRARLGSIFDPSTFTIDDLSALPILTKAEIIEKPASFLIADAGDYDVRSTSGSSGRPPAKIYLDRGRSVREMAFLHHIWSRIGYRLGDGRAVLRDYTGHTAREKRTWRYDPSLRELWLSPFQLNEATIDQYLELFHRYEIRFLYSYPSALSIVARQALRRQWKPPRCLRGILAGSESLFSHQHRLIEKCFGVPVMGHYGMSERVAIAGEIVASPETYELEPLYGVVELVDDDGEPVTIPGRRGRLISTGLFSQAMALIRYDTGDRATLVRSATSKNQFRMRVCDIRSKWNQEIVVGYDGQKIPVTSLDPENYFGILKEYQYVQSIPGRAVFRVVPCAGVTKAEVDTAVKAFRERVRGVIDFELEIVPDIPVGLTGKRNFVLQEIPDAGD
jgi:phenylacetate-CoA ligase